MTVTRKISRITALMAAVVAVLAVASCTGSSGVIVEDPNDTSASSTPTSKTLTSGPTVHTTGTASAPTGVTSSNTTGVPTTDSTGAITSSTTNTETISPQEAADRAAAESAWIDYNDGELQLWKEPKKSWAAFYEKHTVEPLRSQAFKQRETSVNDGKGHWGAPVHHPYWLVPIDGKPVADLMDCIDARNTGTTNLDTGKKLTRGVEHDNTHITLFRQADGGWKVMQVTNMPNLACPGAPTANQEKTSMEAAQSSSINPAATETQ